MKVLSMRIYNRTDQLRVFGLVGFEVQLDHEADTTATFQIKVLEHSRTFQNVDLKDHRPGTKRPSQALVFHLNTFLLPNAPCMVELFLASGVAEGRRLAAYEIAVDNHGELALRTRKALEDRDANAILPAMVGSADFGDHEAPNLKPWFDSEPHLRETVGVTAVLPGESPGEPAKTTEEALANLRKFGFCVLPERVPDELCERLVGEATGFVVGEGRHQGYQWGSSQRVLNTHQLAAGREVWLYPPVINFLKRWFRDEPAACQTLFYFFGSEQNGHQDTIHLTPFPAGYMCGVWVALEDVRAGSGELFVYPQSQCLPRLRVEKLNLSKVAADYSSFKVFDDAVKHLISTNALEKFAYLPKKGQILVWHENLIHGGEKRLKLESSRFSIVSHYFARGAVAYYDARGEAAALQEIGTIRSA